MYLRTYIFKQKCFKCLRRHKNEYLICFVTSSRVFFLSFQFIFTIRQFPSQSFSFQFFFRSIACSKTLMKCYYICCFDVLSIIIECIMHIEHFNIYYACGRKLREEGSVGGNDGVLIFNVFDPTS